MKAAADWGTLTHSRVGRLKVAMTGVPSACDSDKQQAVAKDWGTPAVLQVPPSARRGRGWCVGGGGPTRCMPFNNGTSFPRQTRLSLGAFLALEPLTPIPPVIFMQPTVVPSLDLLFIPRL